MWARSARTMGCERCAMNEQEWLAGTMPKWMLEHVRLEASERKLRLFAVASLRTLPDTDGLRVLELAEGRAHGTVALAQVRAEASRGAGTPFLGLTIEDAFRAAHAYVSCVGLLSRAGGGTHADLLARYGRLLHCLFGNPFRPVPRDAAWLAAGQVRQLAEV